MMRKPLLWLSKRQSIFNFVRKNSLARKFASRFVAGETIEDAIKSAKELQAKGITVSLDLLGESVTKPEESVAAKDMYLEILRSMRDAGLEVNSSLKLTQMGLDIDAGLCARNVGEILDLARENGGFIRLDMESSEYTDKTLDFFEKELYPRYPAEVGVVIQTALRRSTEDIRHLNQLKARVRLCKGAYLEPPQVAFPDKKDVDAHYVQLFELLLNQGNYPGFATHDELIIRQIKEYVAAHDIARDRFEFQMLYGVRRDLQEQLVRDGYRLRVYIPFGTQWYPYLMRRLAERPANIAFILGNIVKEAMSRS